MALAQRSTSVLAVPGVATATSLELEPGLLLSQWQEIGRELRRVEGAVLWWIGDWLRYGERAYGEKYREAVEATGYAYETLRSAEWVARRVETVRRRTVLPWAHHREVAALEPAGQVRWLAWAVEEKASVRALRTAIKAEKNGAVAEPESEEASATDDASKEDDGYDDIGVEWHPDPLTAALSECAKQMQATPASVVVARIRRQYEAQAFGIDQEAIDAYTEMRDWLTLCIDGLKPFVVSCAKEN